MKKILKKKNFVSDNAIIFLLRMVNHTYRLVHLVLILLTYVKNGVRLAHKKTII